MQPGGSTQADEPGEIELQAMGSKKLSQRNTVITVNPTDEKLQGINCVDILMSWYLNFKLLNSSEKFPN